MNPTGVKPQCAYSWHPVGDSHQKLGEVRSSAQVRVTVCSLHCCMKGDTGVCDPSSRKAWVHTTEAADGLTFMHTLLNAFLHCLNKHLLRRHRWRKPQGGWEDQWSPKHTVRRRSAGTEATQCHSQKDGLYPQNPRLGASSHHLQAVHISKLFNFSRAQFPCL